jgi:hypothetical protein
MTDLTILYGKPLPWISILVNNQQKAYNRDRCCGIIEHVSQQEKVEANQS